MDYQWNWSVIPQYLFRHDAQTGWTTNMLIQGFITTLKLSIWSTLLAVLLGMGMALFKMSGRMFRRLIANTYVGLIRNSPPLVLVFIFYFFIGDQIMTAIAVRDWIHFLSDGTVGILSILFAPPDQLAEFFSAVITLGLYEGAYMTEIIRAGIESVEKGQWEAAYALGLSRFQLITHVILPQAIRTILPPLAGQFISTIKDSAIVSVISIQELTFQGMELMAATYLTFEVWITITLMYFSLTFTCSLIASHIEKRLQLHG